MSELNIYQRMNKITASVGGIPKNGWNSHGKYNYVQAVDAINEISKLLVANGVNMSISDNLENRGNPGQGKQIHAHINCEAVFTNIDKPEEQIKVKYSSVSADTSDKDIFKAKTNGLKYLFTQMFLLVTDDVRDTEESIAEPKPKPENNADDFDALIGLIKSSTRDFSDKDLMVSILKHLKVENSAELKTKSCADLKDMYNAVIEFMG